MTRWAKDVSPDNVWSEYPRPQLVRKEWTNLNGLWDYAIEDKGAERPEAWDGQILVPFAVESALSGVMQKVTPEQYAALERAAKLEQMDSPRWVNVKDGQFATRFRLPRHG